MLIADFMNVTSSNSYGLWFVLIRRQNGNVKVVCKKILGDSSHSSFRVYFDDTNVYVYSIGSKLGNLSNLIHLSNLDSCIYPTASSVDISTLTEATYS